MIKIKELFDISNGNGLALSELEESKTGINFISRGEKNNGVVSKVKRIPNLEPFDSFKITVSLGGSVLESFFQDEPFYTAYHIKVLTPRVRMTKEQMIFYCYAIKHNKFRYNYGRQANRTLDDLLIPSLKQIPTWVKGSRIPSGPTSDSLNPDLRIKLSEKDWSWFDYKDVFKILNGFYNKKPSSSLDGYIPFIGATEFNNGVTSLHTKDEIHEASKTGRGKNHPLSYKLFEGGKYITISNNGSVGYAFFQPETFTCSHDVNPVTILDDKQEMNVFIAMFLATLIELEQFRWDYGRKWRPSRMPTSKIKLPINKEGNPDWQFMEDYIKSLPYSKNLE